MFQKILAWVSIVGGIGVGIFLIVIPEEPPNVGIYLRGIVVAIFGILWGLRTLRKAKISNKI